LAVQEGGGLAAGEAFRSRLLPPEARSCGISGPLSPWTGQGVVVARGPPSRPPRSMRTRGRGRAVQGMQRSAECELENRAHAKIAKHAKGSNLILRGTDSRQDRKDRQEERVDFKGLERPRTVSRLNSVPLCDLCDLSVRIRFKNLGSGSDVRTCREGAGQSPRCPRGGYAAGGGDRRR